MTFKIKLLTGEIVVGEYNQDINRSQVDKNSNTLHIFEKLNQNGDEILTVEEMRIAAENLTLSDSLSNLLKNPFSSDLFGKKAKRIEDLISKIDSKNIHAVLAGFQAVSKHSNETLEEWNSRVQGRRAGETPLTLTQAIINCKSIAPAQKKEFLHKILDTVSEASNNNYNLSSNKREEYIADLNQFIDNLTFKNSTNADLLNALIYVLLPNNGCAHDWKNILTSNGYDIDNLY